ncbi:MAG: DsbA family protein [Gammaproteobacteria bacterium]|nr:DsbA family protein [Gammaproteobacteria bacterium]
MNSIIKASIAATLLSTLAATSFAANTPASAQVSVTPAERAKIETVVQQYLMQKPEVIIEAVQNFQRKQYEQAELTVKKTQQTASTFAAPLFRQDLDPIAGNPKGKVTIVEFFDYQCTHCVDMAPVVDAIIKANPDVRFVFKEFPIRGPLSDFAARAALAANKQGKYYQFSHALLGSNKPLTQELVYEVAQASGVDVDQMKKDMNNIETNNQLKKNMKLGQDLQLFGTPAFFIGKTDMSASGSINYVPGRMDQAQLQEAIDKTK